MDNLHTLNSQEPLAYAARGDSLTTHTDGRLVNRTVFVGGVVSRDGYELYADEKGCETAFELVMIALTLPLWTFITLYVILLLIYYLRRLQYFSLYDKCTSRNAHFRYDFHLIAGRHSLNYNRNENVILDLLDHQMISSMTIQIPGNTIYNDQQMFVYRHARSNQRCVNFTVYRRHPIKDVKCLRIAHSCSNPDSRLFIYGIDVHDKTNGESKFFPVQSAIKYRGTQWALVTTFEPKHDVNFKKMGLDCYDPFGYSVWPTYMETLTIILYIWCSSFCFGHLIKVHAISNSVPLHALTLLFIVASSTAVLSAIYLRMIKSHIQDLHYDSYWWHTIQRVYAILVTVVSICFWTLALNQSKHCARESIQWLISTASCSLILTTMLILVWLISNIRRGSSDRALMLETDATMIKTNSKETLPFATDATSGICALLTAGAPKQRTDSIRTSLKVAPAANSTTVKNSRASGSSGKKNPTEVPVAAAAPLPTPTAPAPKAVKTGQDDETLDNAFGHGSKYMKTRNRNSISQYV